jgi:hypothetical protein
VNKNGMERKPVKSKAQNTFRMMGVFVQPNELSGIN